MGRRRPRCNAIHVLQLTQRPIHFWCVPKQSGAAEYLSVSVFENSSPHDLLEFFNDDSHRLQWDDMFIGFEVLDSDPRTGAEVARWVRRFPLMCCPRDYVFARRSFVDGCVGVHCSACRCHPAFDRPLTRPASPTERTCTQSRRRARILGARPAAGAAA